MSEALGNQVDAVLVSQATRDMSRGTYSGNETTIDDEIDHLISVCGENTARKRQIEARLAILNSRVVGYGGRYGGRLPHNEYQAIVQEQVGLKRELGDLAREFVPADLKLGKLKRLRESNREANRVAKKVDQPMSPILLEILKEIRLMRILMEEMRDKKD